MNPNNSIQRTGIGPSHTPLRESNSESVQGNRRGETLSLAPAKDIDDTIQIENFKRITNSNTALDAKSLQERAASLEKRPSLLPSSQIKAYTKAFNSQKATTKLALQYLKYLKGENKKPIQDASLQSLMQHYMGLQKLAHALKGSEQDLAAALTPLQEQPENLAELAQYLKEAGDDPEALASLLEDVEGLPKEEESLFQMMKTLRFQPQQLGMKLRDSQRLPKLTEREKEETLEQVEDELRELEHTHSGRILASKNSLNSALQSDNPQGFIEGYSELVESSGGFSQTFEQLISRYKPIELLSVLPLMKQALGDDIRADLRSTDKIKLEFLLNEIAYMQISSNFLKLGGDLIAGLQRLFYAEKKPSPFTTDEQKFLLALIKTVSGGWVSPSQFDRLASELSLDDGPPTIYFLHGTKHLLRELPFKVFTDDESRSAVLEAVQTALDHAIEREEAATSTNAEGSNE